MSASQRGLGRGLETLFKGGRETEGTGPAQTLPSASIVPNPQQPRRHFAEQPIEELAASIKAQGILQPIVVRPVAGSSPQRYEIVAGERRWRASKLAGLTTVPVVIRDLTDQEALVLALMENLQREDLSPLEEAHGLQQLKDEFGLSQEDLAQRLGKSRSAIANTLRLLSLPESVRNDLAEGKLSAGHAKALLMVSDPSVQDELRKRILRDHLTVREVEAQAAVWKETGALPEATSMVAGSGRKSRGGRAEAPANEALQTVQQSLEESLALPVRIRGQEEKGRISIAYSSKEELHAFLSRLGLAGVAL